MKELLQEKKEIEQTLSSLVYGAYQIRESNNAKYVYVFYRESGILKSKYAGVYSEKLLLEIKQNNNVAKELKKRLKQINKELDSIEQDNFEIEDDVNACISLGRRYLVDLIYKQSVLEGIATTYSDTETLVNEGKAINMDAEDVTKILNLKHSWNFIMDRDVLTYPTKYAILCEINKLVEEGLTTLAGRLRNLPVSIGGSNYVPPIPIEYEVKERLESILYKPIEVETAIELILYIMKAQLFIDGNKRTAIIFGNHYLIRNGLGLMVIPAELVPEYKKLLIDYYEDKDVNAIKAFLKEKCWIKLK